MRGWQAFFAGDLATAAKRFNQAFLIDPTDADIYHAMAVIAHARFSDESFADELFRLALRLPGRSLGVKADYGRFLVVTGNLDAAKAVLEEAVGEEPENATAWSNLGFARLGAGDKAGACKALATARSLSATPPGLESELEILAKRAKCGAA